MLQYPDAPPIAPTQAAVAKAMKGSGYWRLVWSRLRRQPVSLVAITILLAIVFVALFAPWLVPHNPYTTSAVNRLLPIGSEGHILGTDENGRDLLSRLMYGARLTLLSGVLPILVGITVGGTLGVLAGYAGGWVNTLIMRITDVFYAFPPVLLAIAITGTLGTGMINMLIALSVTFTPPLIRIAETVTTQVRTQDYVEAARISGADTLSIMRHHIMNNVMGPILVYATSLISISIILAAGLSFLGLGVASPLAEWGLMLNGLRQMVWIDPVLAALPGVMIFITSMSFNLLSDGLRQAMDVRL
jgi:peptide/nickel transport system permease protein